MPINHVLVTVYSMEFYCSIATSKPTQPSINCITSWHLPHITGKLSPSFSSPSSKTYDAMKVAETSKRRYALLLAAQDSEYALKMYNGYFNVFVAAFGDNGERWDLFRAVDGELPAVEDLDEYDGFVISGSPHDAYADDLWIRLLCILVEELDAMHKRVLGICFGHQVSSQDLFKDRGFVWHCAIAVPCNAVLCRKAIVLCRALGGSVGKARGGWDLGIREVTMVNNLPPYRFLDALQDLPPYAKITECHQDEVWEVPLGAEVLAFSEKTGVEMFCVGDRVLGIQGHPEYTNDILLSLVDRLVASGSIHMVFAEAVKRQLESTEPDREFWVKLCKSFLKTEA